MVVVTVAEVMKEVMEEAMEEVATVAALFLQTKEEEFGLWRRLLVDMAIRLSKRSATKTSHRMTNLVVCRLQLPSKSNLSVAGLR